ncbi:hypothetical protein ACLI4U_15010 [Natrialbaceae archaeon A-CW2]
MVHQRRLRFIHGQLAWMVAAIFFLAVLDSLSLGLFFLISLLGLLIVTDLTTPQNVTPAWRSRLRWVILAGLVGTGYVVAQRFSDIISTALFI